MWPVVVLLPVAYLLGTFPSAVLVARSRGIDITAEGSGNPGASNVIRVLGWKVGAVVLVFDCAKGAAAGGLGLWVGGRPGASALGVAAVLGHTFPMLRRGGKGVAAAGGMLLVLYPIVAAVLAVVWGVIARGLRKASFASLLITIAFPITVALLRYDWWETAVVSVISLLLVVRHASNIRRLVRREEHDLVGGSAPPRRRPAA